MIVSDCPAGGHVRRVLSRLAWLDILVIDAEPRDEEFEGDDDETIN
jgi:hypothetical protein